MHCVSYRRAVLGYRFDDEVHTPLSYNINIISYTSRLATEFM